LFWERRATRQLNSVWSGSNFLPTGKHPPDELSIPMNEFDLTRPDLTRFDLWLRPAYDVPRQAFHLCRDGKGMM